MKHPDNVEGWNGSLDDLAKAISVMKYDSIAYLLYKLAYDLNTQAISDINKGRVKLAGALNNSIKHLLLSVDELMKVWEICKPYMKDE